MRRGLNRLTSSKDGSGATVGYSYDLNGDLTQLTYPGNHAAARTFDQDSRMASVSDWLGNTEVFAYDANSNLTSSKFPVSTSEVDQQAFDNADNLISIVDTGNSGNQGNSKAKSDNAGNTNGQALASFFYTRDANNQVTSESSNPNNGNNQSDGNSAGSKSYTYTPLNQLQNVNNASYSYSPADNLVKLITGTTQLFDPANQLISSTTGNQDTNSGNQKGGQPVSSSQTKTTYSYDLNGNRIGTTTGSTPTTLGFDQANRLINFNSTSSYGYNGDGLRMSKTVASQSQHMTWDLAEGLPLTLSDASNQYIYGPDGLPIEQISSTGRIDFFHHDQLGSTRLLTSTKGVVEGTFAFDPYGNLTSSSGNGQAGANSNSDSNHTTKNQATTPLLFAGQYLDAESGLYYLRSRYYDPETGQFVSLDLAVAKTRSPYAYVAGNPLNKTDPSGLYVMGCDAQGTPIDNGLAGPSNITCYAATSYVSIKDGPGIPLTSEWLTVSWTDTGGQTSNVNSTILTQGHNGGFVFGQWDVTGQGLTSSGCTVTGTTQFVDQGYGLLSSPGFYMNTLQTSITIGSNGNWSSSSWAYGTNSFVNTFNAHGGAWSGPPGAGPNGQAP